MSSRASASSIAITARSFRESPFILGWHHVRRGRVRKLSRSFYLKTYFNTPRLPLLFRLHSTASAVWILFFMTQAWLVWRQKTDSYRHMSRLVLYWQVWQSSLLSRLHSSRAPWATSTGFLAHEIPRKPDFFLCSMSRSSWRSSGAGLLWRTNSEVHLPHRPFMAVPLLPSAVARLSISIRASPNHFFCFMLAALSTRSSPGASFTRCTSSAW